MKPEDASRTVILKNEFGDSKADSHLLRSYNVTEMINGCLCCVLVGQIKTALLDLKEKYHPDRVIVETSGSAFPAPLSIQIRETLGFALDSICTVSMLALLTVHHAQVIDCVNFMGYEDKSYTAKIQAQYTGTPTPLTPPDLILMNKADLVSPRQYDLVLDRVNDLNTDTPKIRLSSLDSLELGPELVFGLGERYSDPQHQPPSGVMVVQDHHAREVDLLLVRFPQNPNKEQVDGSLPSGAAHDHNHDHDHGVHDCGDASQEHTTHGSLHNAPSGQALNVSREQFTGLLDALDKECVFRVKGFIRLTGTEGESDTYLVNWAFGRYTLEIAQADGTPADGASVWITVMGHLDAMVRRMIKTRLGIQDDAGISFIARKENE